MINTASLDRMNMLIWAMGFLKIHGSVLILPIPIFIIMNIIIKPFKFKIGTVKIAMEYAEKNHHFTVSEYDENLKIIRIVAYYEGSDLYAPRDEPIETLYLKDGYPDIPIEFDN
jgi:hypothetical protein